ncbi:unnamed protein product [Nippostrongylus brasiliensis]|uniref:Uncharacterized protein n=1 Tax=Nippostrongylus brasiliensis TaxID=27835 RepID=A0A0N4YAN5_NIPBR|nr:unnamed protein product [Nippostrongylus brasiliensis]
MGATLRAHTLGQFLNAEPGDVATKKYTPGSTFYEPRHVLSPFQLTTAVLKTNRKGKQDGNPISPVVPTTNHTIAQQQRESNLLCLVEQTFFSKTAQME